MQGISKSFPGVKALDQVNLMVRPGSVHALLGENGAGKSTLVKCLFGIYQKDEGSIKFKGKDAAFLSPKHALESGIAMVHQELEQVPLRNVADNVWLGRYPLKGGFVDEKKMYEDTKKIFDQFQIDINPHAILKNLPVADRQMIEIAKAVSYNASVVILDEPTSSLTEKEVVHLFRIINMLRDQGISFVYISHKLEEIAKITDEVTILRDGKFIVCDKTKNLSLDDIIMHMVGRSLTQRFPSKENAPGDVLMQVKNVSTIAKNCVRNVSFELRRGEILGISGLLGAKKTELVETVFGLREMTPESEILLNGKPIVNRNSVDAINNKFALCTEERRFNGIFPGLSVRFNATMANIRAYSKLGFLNDRSIAKDTQWVIDSVRVKTPNQTTRIRSLSGGNQQKVILGKWMLTKPDVLMLDDPTRGVDVGAKFEIYQLIIEMAKEGKGIIFISSEMPELLGICDRILVMSNGKVGGIVDVRNNPEESTQENLMRMATSWL